MLDPALSPLIRGRELKLLDKIHCFYMARSPLIRGRELKRPGGNTGNGGHCRPLYGGVS